MSRINRTQLKEVEFKIFNKKRKKLKKKCKKQVNFIAFLQLDYITLYAGMMFQQVRNVVSIEILHRANVYIGFGIRRQSLAD
jgi:hypothetical protein